MKGTPPSSHGDKAPLGVFLAAAVVIFFLTLSAADSVGFVPCWLDNTCEVSNKKVSETWDTAVVHEEVADTVTVQTATRPERIRIGAIDLDLPVQNPETLDLEELDVFLREGPARYASSAQLGEPGTMIIFAHSSHLPVVHNQMYRAFNRVPELKKGDTITIDGDGVGYLYSVVDVKSVDVNGADATIDLSTDRGTHLTLVTCDTLTGKSARFVVEAELVGTLKP